MKNKTLLTAEVARSIAKLVTRQEIAERELNEVLTVIEEAASKGKDELCYPDNLLPQTISMLKGLGYDVEAIVDFTWICWREFATDEDLC